MQHTVRACVWVRLFVQSLVYTCGVRCHIHENVSEKWMRSSSGVEHTKLQISMDRRSNQMYEHTKTTDSNALIHVVVGCACAFDTDEIPNRICFFWCVGLFWCAGTLCLMHICSWSLFVYLFVCLCSYVSRCVCERAHFFIILVFILFSFYEFVALGWPRLADCGLV